MWTILGIICIFLGYIYLNFMFICTEDFANDHDDFGIVTAILNIIFGIIFIIVSIVINSPLFLLGLLLIAFGVLTFKSVDDCQGIAYSFISDIKKKESMRGK